MKKILLILLIFISISCQEPDNISPIYNDNVISGIISEDQTWSSDKIWELSSKVIVPSGITLTIQEGTIIKGKSGNGSLSTALIIARGGTLIAEGTITNPIIFTSSEDNIQLGEKYGTNLSELDNEKWGGLIILGDAPISAENGDTESLIEGLPADESYGLYGGDNPEDNSGILKYISIRHGGTEIGAGNEINGLTLGGVGNNTIIDNIEIYSTLDDGIEFFGGTVNATNLIVSYQGDDGIDIDQNYSGTIDNFIIIEGETSDESLEIDGPEGLTYTNGLFTLLNGLIISESSIDLKSNAQGTLDNITFKSYSEIKVRTSYDDNCEIKKDAYLNLIDNLIQVKNVNFNKVQLYTSSTCEISTDDQANVERLIFRDTSQGASITPFDWTLSKIKGIL